FFVPPWRRLLIDTDLVESNDVQMCRKSRDCTFQFVLKLTQLLNFSTQLCLSSPVLTLMPSLSIFISKESSRSLMSMSTPSSLMRILLLSDSSFFFSSGQSWHLSSPSWPMTQRWPTRPVL